MYVRNEDQRRLTREWARRSRAHQNQGHGRLQHGNRDDPNTLADKALATLPPSAIDALMTCYRAGRIRADAVSESDLKALRKAYLVRRWEDPDTGERSREWYDLSPSGRWAAGRRAKHD